jgi:NADP-dependent 3-hydroxy acid dehydrogenase YdfG
MTGGGSGIGEAGAKALAAGGWTVAVSGRRKDALDAVVAGNRQKRRRGQSNPARRQGRD